MAHDCSKKHINHQSNMEGVQMKLILRIILFPITLLLTILSYFLTFLLGIGTWLLNIVSGLIIIGAVASFINGETSLGVTALILAFLFSPYGLPLIAEKLVFGIGKITVALKSI